MSCIFVLSWLTKLTAKLLVVVRDLLLALKGSVRLKVETGRTKLDWMNHVSCVITFKLTRKKALPVAQIDELVNTLHFQMFCSVMDMLAHSEVNTIAPSGVLLLTNTSSPKSEYITFII